VEFSLFKQRHDLGNFMRYSREQMRF